MAQYKVQGYRNIIKDSFSRAVINTDKSAYLMHVRRIREARDNTNQLKDAVRDINSLKSEMFEIKQLLKKMVK